MSDYKNSQLRKILAEQGKIAPRIRIQHFQGKYDVVHYAGGETDKMTILISDMGSQYQAEQVALKLSEITGAKVLY